ncbi:MAG: hypothetical protein WBE76_24545 [Terracidiphilus sp.]
MLNSTTLEVAIGMALVYLSLSLFCTAINEAIAGILGSRAKNLEKGIRSLFTEGELTITEAIKTGGTTTGGTDVQPATVDAVASAITKTLPPAAASAAAAAVTKTVGLVDAIYQHGLVQSLYKSGAGIEDQLAKDLKNRPSYIPSRTFSAALFDILFPQPLAPAAASGAGPSAPQATQTAVLENMISSLDKISEGPAKEAIATLVKQANGDIDKTRKAFELWYNDGMDRASGWYKRKTQLVLFFIGLILAVALNVDSIRVAEVLWTTPALRSYAVASAEQFVKDHPTAATADGTTAMKPADLPQYLQSLKALNLPLGWNSSDLAWIGPGADYSFPGVLSRVYWGEFVLVVAGWFLTAIAMTLGAPFWFDLLNQFMVVRSTIKPDEKSGDEASKDPHS